MRAPDLAAADYARALLALLPPGAAWPREPGSTVALLADALAGRAAAVHDRAADLLAEAYPPTTLEMLGDWEASLGLPDPCVGAGQSSAQRRAAVAARLAGRGGQSVPYLTAVAESLGFAVTITEYQPAQAGIAVAGSAVHGEDWAHAFTVRAPEQTVVEAVAGSTVAGDPIRAWGNLPLQCVLARLRPGHSTLILAYGS